MENLTTATLYQLLKQTFPARNDDYESDYVEELQELNDFGIYTDQQLLALLEKRTAEVMEIDRSPMNESEIAMHSSDGQGEFVAARLKAGYWFSYPALLRIALELEYGEAYRKYANERDRVP